MEPIALRAGDVRLEFVPDDASVRHIRWGALELIRGITAPVRDPVWATIPPQISQLKLDQGANWFRLTFIARCIGGPVDFKWEGELSGNGEGTLQFGFRGEALSDFRRNRIGFCVLHPAEVAGCRCRVEHVDGTSASSQFPEAIQPEQPFKELRAISHDAAPGVRCDVRMEGDVFEMEDQRNWTDASFKTYCTPLARPMPVAVRKGDRIEQRVSVRVSVDATVELPPAPRAAAAPVGVTIGAGRGVLCPPIGICWTRGSVAVGPYLPRARPSHLRVDLWLSNADSVAELEEAANVANAMRCPLELAVHVNEAGREPLERLRHAMEQTRGVAIARWMVFQDGASCTPPECCRWLRDEFAGSVFAAPVGGGATDNFTELNRQRRIVEAAEFTVHACNPQVHAVDDEAIMETVRMQGLTIAGARQLSDGLPAVVSPVTLTRRWRVGEPGFPPGAAGPVGLLPFQPDERLFTRFAAAWFLGSVASCIGAGAQSLTYFETSGPAGIFDARRPLPPVGDAFTRAAACVGKPLRVLQVTDERRVAGLAVDEGGGVRVLLANLTNGATRVRLTAGEPSTMLELAPYGWCETFDGQVVA